MKEQPSNPFAELNESTSLREINAAVTPFGSMISLRYFGEYTGKAIFLGAGGPCQWKIVKDSQDCWCLVPKTLKKQLENK